jgi:hypothetical protein
MVSTHQSLPRSKAAYVPPGLESTSSLPEFSAHCNLACPIQYVLVSLIPVIIRVANTTEKCGRLGTIKAAGLATEPSYPPNVLIHLQTIKSVVHVHDMAEGSKLRCAQQKMHPMQ